MSTDALGAQLLPQLARLLIQRWTDEGQTPGDLPNEGFLQEGLEHLVKIGLLSLGGVVPAVAVDLAIAGIKKFQERDRQIFKDGVLKRGLIARLLAAAICPDRPDHDTSRVKRLTGNEPAGEYTIRYFLDSSVDDFIDRVASEELIATAWQHWIAVTKHLIVDRAPDAASANVLVKMERIDGNFGVLGRAPVAGPGNFNNLEVVLDKAETWDARLFLAAACHEFGHVLGLGHSSHSNQLMSPIIPDDVRAPQGEDIAAIQAIYQKSGREQPPPPAFRIF